MTMTGIRLVSSADGSQTAEWRPSDGRNINVVASNNTQAVCSCGKQLFYFELNKNSINLVRYPGIFVFFKLEPVLGSWQDLWYTQLSRFTFF